MSQIRLLTLSFFSFFRNFFSFLRLCRLCSDALDESLDKDRERERVRDRLRLSRDRSLRLSLPGERDRVLERLRRRSALRDRDLRGDLDLRPCALSLVLSVPRPDSLGSSCNLGSLLVLLPRRLGPEEYLLSGILDITNSLCVSQ